MDVGGGPPAERRPLNLSRRFCRHVITNYAINGGSLRGLRQITTMIVDNQVPWGEDGGRPRR